MAFKGDKQKATRDTKDPTGRARLWCASSCEGSEQGLEDLEYLPPQQEVRYLPQGLSPVNMTKSWEGTKNPVTGAATEPQSSRFPGNKLWGPRPTLAGALHTV